MPSWNIHSAHVERLLAEEDPWRLGIDDDNCFQFGNYVPDVYVGYMVKPTTHLIDYKVTHVSSKAPIPIPRYNEFWERFVAHGGASDLTLGAFAHLVCDALYNQATRSYLAEHGLEPGPEARVGKQRDFALFGNTIPLSRHVEVTDALLEQCEEFPHYPVLEPLIQQAVGENVSIISSSDETAKEVVETLTYRGHLCDGSIPPHNSFNTTGHDLDEFRQIGGHIFGEPIEDLSYVDIDTL